MDGDAENIIDLCMRLSGYTKNISDEAHKAEFLKQAEEYKALIKDDVLNQTMEFMILAGQSHPMTAVRAYEANAWAASDNVTRLLSYYGEVSRSMPHTEVPVAEAAALMKGRNAEALAAELKEAGFTDVTCVRQTSADLFTSPGTVTGISINGDSDFKAESWFACDAKVEITCYEPLTPEEEEAAHPGEIRMPVSSLSCYGRDYVSLCQEFVNSGYKNIFTVQDPGIRPLFLKDGGVTKVTVGEVSDFEKGDWFPANIKIRVMHF